MPDSGRSSEAEPEADRGGGRMLRPEARVLDDDDLVPAPKQDQDLPSITSIALLVAPLVAALGLLTATGIIGRIQRDHPLEFAIAIGVVLIAGGIWVLVPQLVNEGRHATAKSVLQGIAIALALGGFILAMGLAIELAADEPRPRIGATLSDDRSTLDATVSASGLGTKHRLAIEVDVLQRSPENTEEIVASERVYRAYVGPDSDGNVTHPIKVPLPRGSFTDVAIKAYTGVGSTGCDDYPEELLGGSREFGAGSGTGCVTMALVPPSETAEHKPRP